MDIGAVATIITRTVQRRCSRVLRVVAGAAALLLALAPGFESGAEACPNAALFGERRTYSAEQLYQPVRLRIPAGGNVSLSNCASVPGRGWVTRQPDLTLDLSDNRRGRRLEFRVNSACDAVLLINSPSGKWFFDDDSNGDMDPRWSIDNARTGYWDVWVGRLGQSASCDATLTIETF